MSWQWCMQEWSTQYQISQKYMLTPTNERFIDLSWNETYKCCFLKNIIQTYKIFYNAKIRNTTTTISACPLNFDVRSSIFPDIKRECIAVKDSLSFVINIRLKSKLFTFHVKEYSCKKLFLFDEKLCMPSWEWDCLKYGITISQNEKKPQVRRYC